MKQPGSWILELRAIPQKDWLQDGRMHPETGMKSETSVVCSSVNIGSTKAGINMDAVAQMGRVVKETAGLTADTGGIGAAKLVVFANAKGKFGQRLELHANAYLRGK